MSRLFKKQEEKKSLWERIKEIALTDVTVLVGGGLNATSLERLEELLLANDFGVPVTMRIVDRMETATRQMQVRTERELHTAVEQEIVSVLTAGNADSGLRFSPSDEPTVILVAGVNGVGKTTTIGKLSHRLKGQGKRVLLAAADTFRAGAIDQLRIWAERVGAEFVGARPGADPAAVAFDAIEAAKARGADVVIIDTAGRLHTQDDLMAELGKVERVVAKKVEGAPHETLLVLDATVGQNAVAQVRMFGSALRLTGLVLSKLDSSAKGGIVIALKEQFDVPVKLIGVGEGVGDLEAFQPERFARDVLAA